MKSYYHSHESAYKKLKSDGYCGWDRAKNIDELGDEETRKYLKSTIEKHFANPLEKKALDLGCGTGTTAFILSQFGFEVSGIDISETAIEMARELAHQQNLKIKFFVGDALSLTNLNEKFDLIYDSHCLHCIVFDEDRFRVLEGIKNSLASGGIFVLDTMVTTADSINPALNSQSFRFDDEFILWHKTKPSTDRGVVEIDGQHWCAQRRIYPPEKVKDETLLVGLEIISEQLNPQSDGPSMLRLVLK